MVFLCVGTSMINDRRRRWRSLALKLHLYSEADGSSRPSHAPDEGSDNPESGTQGRLCVLCFTENFLSRGGWRLASDSARYFRKVIAGTNGLSKAADLLERAFGVA